MNDEEGKTNVTKEVRPMEPMERDVNRKVVIKSGDQTKVYTMMLGESIRERINLRPGNKILQLENGF